MLPVLLYGSENWMVSCALESRLDAFYNRSLCRIMRYSWQDHVSNQRLHRETGTCTISNMAKQARFLQDDPAHQVISVQDKPGWRRPVGRPRKVWLGQIDKTCYEELEMDLALACRLAMRDPHR
ncbi:uncharacterized protein LOC119577631 [Penaeus monodon]|uniref:uncharacterized protein LOC119577631 n=1 Tax=Penaeus monodon TaxID=6687 RepID=UPI0018A781BB|nr:uncharacterized protein LOC119577631 [Penaeus monodon]